MNSILGFRDLDQYWGEKYWLEIKEYIYVVHKQKCKLYCAKTVLKLLLHWQCLNVEIWAS